MYWGFRDSIRFYIFIKRTSLRQLVYNALKCTELCQWKTLFDIIMIFFLFELILSLHASN